MKSNRERTGRAEWEDFLLIRGAGEGAWEQGRGRCGRQTCTLIQT